VVPEISHPDQTVLATAVHVPVPWIVVPPVVVFLVAKQLTETLVAVLLLEHSVVLKVDVTPVMSQP
jgi:hypothetical protein